MESSSDNEVPSPPPPPPQNLSSYQSKMDRDHEATPVSGRARTSQWFEADTDYREREAEPAPTEVTPGDGGQDKDNSTRDERDDTRDDTTGDDNRGGAGTSSGTGSSRKSII